jgi:PAS domain S-box-containing protein
MKTKSIEEKFQEQEQRLGLLAKGLVDVLWVVDLETMRYTYISESVEKIRGFTVTEVMDLPLERHLAPPSYRHAVEVIMDGLEAYESDPDVKRTLELEMYHKNGDTIWFEITARLVKEPDGHFKAVGVTKDISERKRHEKEKEQLICQLNNSLTERDRLLRENRILRGLLPICAECKMIRDDDGVWWPVEQYIASRTEADFTHTICPVCKEKALKKIYGSLAPPGP